MTSLITYDAVEARESIRRLGIHFVANRGAGKSRFLGRLVAFNDVAWGIPTIIIDPIGSAIDNLLDEIGSIHPKYQDQIWPRVRYADMAGRGGYVVPFPLYYRMSEEESLPDIGGRFIELIARIDENLETAPINGMNAVRDVGEFAGIILAGLGLQITEAPSLLADPASWAQRLQDLKSRHPSYEVEQAVHFFLKEYSRSQAVSFKNKVNRFVLNPVNRAMFGASNQGINWEEVVEERLCVLIDLSRETNKYMRSIKMRWLFQSLVTYIQAAGKHRCLPISLIIDELAGMYRIGDEEFAGEMDELINGISRNYDVWLTLSHQEMHQFDDETQRTLMDLGTQIIGRTSNPDTALFFAKYFDRIDPLKVKRTENVYMNVGSIHDEFFSQNSIDIIDKRPIEFTAFEQFVTESYKYLEQSPFNFFVRLPGEYGLRRMSAAIIDDDIPEDLEAVEQDKLELMKRHGRKIADVEAEICARLSSDKLLDYEAPRYDIPASKTDNTAGARGGTKADADFEARKRRFISDDE